MNTRCPAAASSAARSHNRSTWRGCVRGLMTWVDTSARPAGTSSKVDTSRSPNTVIATVRGIGVAVITNTCGCVPSGARRARAARCSTPKRCCSSMTTNPKRANCTDSSNRACVPTITPAAPDSIASRASRRWAERAEPVNSTTVVPSTVAPDPRSESASASGPRSRRIPEACWDARTSVGASKTAWPPAATTSSIARTATTVFPLPTSPCSSRCMGTSRARSAAISFPTAACPPVRVKGRPASKVSRRADPAGGTTEARYVRAA